MTALYNEIDPYAVRWLQDLTIEDHIAWGLVDSTDICELPLTHVRRATQFHAFAGIGLWSYALRLAGWGDERPVWTGSCPCQPFSNAGRRKGYDDVRHLWPVWAALIKECRPPTIFGEQVASPLGRAWLDVVSTDLEALGYAVGSADLCAAGVGAPHVRQRLFWVAHAHEQGPQGWGVQGDGTDQRVAGAGSVASGLADSQRGAPERYGSALAGTSAGVQGEAREQRIRPDAGDGGADGGMGITDSKRLDELEVHLLEGEQGKEILEAAGAGGVGSKAWDNPEWLYCEDGKARPTQPGIFPMANGDPTRVAKLRAYGNAIVPILAATFVRAFMDTLLDGPEVTD